MVTIEGDNRSLLLSHSNFPAHLKQAFCKYHLFGYPIL